MQRFASAEHPASISWCGAFPEAEHLAGGRWQVGTRARLVGLSVRQSCLFKQRWMAGRELWAAPVPFDPYHPYIFVYDSINSFACTTYMILIGMTQVQMIHSH